MDLAKVFGRLTYLHGRDNFTEKVLHQFTIWILLFFTILLNSSLLFGSLITCQMPPEAPDSFVEYYKDYCYYQDKWRYNEHKRITTPGLPTPSSNEPGWKHENDLKITYYQWIPYILITQIAMCLVPAVIWKYIGLRFFHGCDFDGVLKGFIYKMPEGMEKQMETGVWIGDEEFKKIAKSTHRLLKLKKDDRYGMHSTTIVYVVMKWTSFLSLFLQFYLMAYMYADGKMLWGVHVTYNVLNGAFEDVYSGLFPWIVKCQVHKFEVAIHDQKLFCLLSQNFLNEKAFLFLYWWYIFSFTVSFCSAVRFTILLLSPPYQRYLTKAILPTQEYFFETTGQNRRSSPTAPNDLLEYFIDYVGCDGYLLFQLVADMTHLVFVRQLSRELWRRVIVKNDDEFEDDDEEEETKDASAPPLDEEDGAGDCREGAGKDKPKLSQLQKDLKDLKNKLAAMDRFDGNEKKPLLYSEPSSSSTKASSSSPSPSGETNKIFQDDETTALIGD